MYFQWAKSMVCEMYLNEAVKNGKIIKETTSKYNIFIY